MFVYKIQEVKGMNIIKLRAYAKINLGLDVVGKREDGYHEVKMIMQTINLYDQITMRKINDTNIYLKTNLHYLPVNEKNLVYKAAKLLKEEFNIEQGIDIKLDKRIPVAAGMAGGSSDAAAALVGMNKLFDLGLSKKELMERGVKLGADVPYCILRGTALSEGIGEVLTPLAPAPECYVLIAKPGISVSTKFVYGNLNLSELKEHPDIDGMIDDISNNNLYGIANKLSNVLETVTIKEYPVIETIKQEMIKRGALGSIMSGSGPTVFGLFDDKKMAKDAFYHMKSLDLAKQVHLTDFFKQKRG